MLGLPQEHPAVIHSPSGVFISSPNIQRNCWPEDALETAPLLACGEFQTQLSRVGPALGLGGGLGAKQGGLHLVPLTMALPRPAVHAPSHRFDNPSISHTSVCLQNLFLRLFITKYKTIYK